MNKTVFLEFFVAHAVFSLTCFMKYAYTSSAKDPKSSYGQ